ncbi:4-hydroxy-tetrahydrodipicolinate synthase [Enterococcus gallinarum]|uniref:4-hydroxy-tetrahydrodipicolinate synthase n=1 Tax=Enterococcus gallinarum TaxID=1353 RepID=UPI001E4BBC98|nr:4-hydroxy-tetrahydrodipicolinate synthase [Enterococcus gallinarum]MCD5186161.1 4-hydroxy-tetrahydrodipicolinate synthase [Enterococcus gallinarum]
MFEGIITPIVTPFHRDTAETINYEAMENLVDHLIEKGVSGIFPLGSNGEFHVLNSEEKMAFSKAVIDHVAKRVPVYIGTGACSTKETIELSQKAESLGADALSVITPYFITPSDEEILQHYQKVANSVQIPIILYNIPKNTGCNISKEVLRELTKLPNVLGIKDSSGDLNNLKDYLEVTEGTKVNVLVGSDSKILAGYKLGASGAIAGTSNLITETIVSLDQAIRGNNWESAEKLQNDIEELRGALKLGTVPSILKRAIELAAIAEVGPARRPVRETTASDDRKILSMLKYYNLID